MNDDAEFEDFVWRNQILCVSLLQERITVGRCLGWGLAELYSLSLFLKQG